MEYIPEFDDKAAWGHGVALVTVDPVTRVKTPYNYDGQELILIYKSADLSLIFGGACTETKPGLGLITPVDKIGGTFTFTVPILGRPIIPIIAPTMIYADIYAYTASTEPQKRGRIQARLIPGTGQL